MDYLKAWYPSSAPVKDAAADKLAADAAKLSLGTASATPTPILQWDQQHYTDIVSYLIQNITFSGVDKNIIVPKTPADMLAAAQNSATSLPNNYQVAYSTPLLENKNVLLDAFKNQELDMTIMETLCAPVYQNDPNFTFKTELSRYQAVINSIYDAFLQKEKRALLHLPLLQQIPPLAMWQSTADEGPFTIPVDAINQIIGGTVGVVSMPSSYMQHPILWASLGHETGGHDVLHADPTLIPELKKKISDQLKNSNGDLWSYWIDETASDVYGILNYGPAFTLNLGFFFGALNKSYGGTQFLRTVSYCGQDGQLDPHPTDILRVGVAMGVIDALPMTDASKKIYLDYLQTLYTFAAAGQTTIKLQQSSGKVDSFPLTDMMDSARKVGHFIATVPLDTFKGKCINEIETWADSDEKLALDLASQFLGTEPISTLLPYDIEHLISAATIALLQSPSSYSSITTRLNEQLDNFVTKDPFFGKRLLVPHRAYIRQQIPLL